jgi:hypothetical protein
VTGARALAALAGSVLLAGCPIPQAVPDYPPGSITPPRILMDQLPGADQRLIFVPAGCTSTHPTYQLSATLDDPNTLELVQARWFVNYDADLPARYNPAEEAPIPGTSGGLTTRTVPTWTFDAYGGYGTATDPAMGNPTLNGELQIVELVVSNGFDDTATALPKRTPQVGFETQVYRWVFFTKNPEGPLTCP